MPGQRREKVQLRLHTGKGKHGRKPRIIIDLLLLLFIVCLATIIMHYAGYDYRIVRTRGEIGIPSYDGKYRLVEMSDPTGIYLLYSVIQVGNAGGPRTVFVTDDSCYHSRFASGYG
ncbi:MAG: hypothetical protein IJH78_08240 [Clostridia bacterium]|nr:hypothetical protein [Clostridia bacterium]